MGKENLVIKGKLVGNNIDFAKDNLSVFAVSEKNRITSAKVNKDGTYELTVSKADDLESLEIKVLPESMKNTGNIASLSKTLSISDIKNLISQEDKVHNLDFYIHDNLINWFRLITRKYRMHGTVFSTVYEDDGNGTQVPISVNPVPMVKIEFYEVDKPVIKFKASEEYIGETITDPNGNYEFNFTFTSFRYRNRILPLLYDSVPDIQARFYQFINGSWIIIHEDKVDWNIGQDFNRSYFIDSKKVTPVSVGASTSPQSGFRYLRLGLIPIDDEHFKEGYVTTKPGDPIKVSHQPFCGILRIYGLFAKNSNVVKYKVMYAKASTTNVTSLWNNVTDTVYNCKWNSSTSIWDIKALGPDPLTGMYQNIDTEPEGDWYDHALKITWNSANHANGYYKLKIIGYDSSDKPVGEYEMPIIRIDNNAPDISLEALGTSLGGVTPCGYLKLNPADRKIKFRIKAFDIDGHVLRYSLSGSRGKDGHPAGSSIVKYRPDTNAGWQGENSAEVEFTVDTLPNGISACPAVAYGFWLEVWGLATNGYSSVVNSQYINFHMNLVVAE
ncbi:hypothetical protein [Pseudobacteroides cellulosolvens]|uniref:Uncharacterized protein n=1 Tax=Pseudobacteroides cellulosolvens ATCC 35603 = DSM 2933 TaxID=398512 RepID=A0A0L6JLZ0_9FIRM|nr:hypothetical protein [Pseudobacteroides cellulosolvens]KNY26821.1 hypothetical protein Bccel_2086 [Pseudobacteroides cellulosolvens ATCC 35603 = DSM 2933]